MKVTGHCFCGAIAFAGEIDPGRVRVCHCTDCQRQTGTAFRTNVNTLPGTFVLLKGTPKHFTKTADSGRQRVNAFCPDCGSPIYSTGPGPAPESHALRVGTLDQKAELLPAVQLWTRSALPWAMDITAVDRREQQ